ncbi:CHAT domain-containing protein [Thermoleptolyngbya oregonensis NK1-22]|uniref:CHAT domain-containing protein n=1 Tax=Thermoleptolyngbya oregonensis NK1-22 TaxID=2547457 RepID=A0AA96YE54_9CYAN|nr:CHAT domain-containing protein [Thermoleptolyngbya oregonensis NK1-22]
MLSSDHPCLRLAIRRLTAADADHYAIWVLQAPSQAGYVHHDRAWPAELTEIWQAWQSMFCLRDLPAVPRIPAVVLPPPQPDDPTPGYAGRLMQHLGVSLWQWLFDGSIQNSLAQSQGIAQGQGRSLRLRLEIRDPELMALPWEIMQPQPGRQAIALSQQLLFSRTTNEVDPLPALREENSLRILLVQGQDAEPDRSLSTSDFRLQLQQEADALTALLQDVTQGEAFHRFVPPVPCEVTTLVQPTAAELTSHLETKQYNVLFYSGHGMPGPDGGMLFLRPDATMNGTELAQVLTRCRIKLAVFNACWGAQPEMQGDRPIPRSSLAEVLIHHGVPAVLGMRDRIAEHEAHSFIQRFARALAERSPIDEAVAIARQHLLTLYRFNQIAWTLPVLYMHPEFDGELVKPLTEGVTEIPENPSSWGEVPFPSACLRAVEPPHQTWPIYGGMVRVGFLEGNDLVIKSPGVSRRHAEIFYRGSVGAASAEPIYVLRDFSRFGTFLLEPQGQWRKVHQEEVALKPHSRLRFGTFQLEFVPNDLTPSL